MKKGIFLYNELFFQEKTLLELDLQNLNYFLPFNYSWQFEYDQPEIRVELGFNFIGTKKPDQIWPSFFGLAQLLIKKYIHSPLLIKTPIYISKTIIFSFSFYEKEKLSRRSRDSTQDHRN